MGETSILQYGLGVIGVEVAKLVIKKKNLKLVGVVDKLRFVGVDLGEALGIKNLGLRVLEDAANALKVHSPKVVLHATSSYIQDTYVQIAECIESGAHVISTCE